MIKRDPITGSYVYLNIDGVEYRVYYEEAGQGIPLLSATLPDPTDANIVICSATRKSTRDFRAIAFDLPFHGKSLHLTARSGGPRNTT